MHRNRTFVRIMVTSLVLFISTSTFAKCLTSDKNTSTNQPSQSMTINQAAAKQSVLYKSKDLIGSDVKSMVIEPDQKKLDKIGQVKELVIDQEHNTIQYVIVSSGGNNFPVPWAVFEAGGGLAYTTEMNDSTSQTALRRATNLENEPTLYLNMTKEQFKHAPTARSTSIANLSDPGLMQTVDSFYYQYLNKQGSIQTSRGNEYNRGQDKVNFVKASDITDLKVQNTANKDLGKINDLVIDSQSGQITYGLVKLGGLFGIGEKTAAVPWSSITTLPQENIAMIDATKQTLEASVLEKGDIIKLTEPDFARMVHNFYGAEPYWETMAFVPGEEIQKSLSAWQSESKYNKNFDPGRMTTIEGTITNVGTFYPEKGSIAGTMLTVQTARGQTVTVHAGPLFHILQEDIQLGTGNDIKVTGSQTMINGKPVIMASQIEVEDKTLKLRDDEGKPLWNVHQFEQKMKNSNKEMTK